MLPKSSQSRKGDFLKMRVSPRRRAHFQRSGQPKGQAREALQARPCQGGLLEPRGGQAKSPRSVLEEEGFNPSYKDGSPRGPWAGGSLVAGQPFGAPEPFQECSKNPDFLTHVAAILAPKWLPKPPKITQKSLQKRTWSKKRGFLKNCTSHTRGTHV